MLKYPIEIFYSEEDEGYIALMPDLPGCNAWGETPTHALEELQDAAESWLEGARKMQRTIPAPSSSRFVYQFTQSGNPRLDKLTGTVPEVMFV